MDRKNNRIHIKNKLNDDDKLHITEIFHEDVEPKLVIMNARAGNINCEFAGEQYKNWVIEFRSAGSGFKIIDFEYDENSRSFELARQAKLTQIAKHV